MGTDQGQVTELKLVKRQVQRRGKFNLPPARISLPG